MFKILNKEILAGILLDYSDMYLLSVIVSIVPDESSFRTNTVMDEFNNKHIY